MKLIIGGKNYQLGDDFLVSSSKDFIQKINKFGEVKINENSNISRNL